MVPPKDFYYPILKLHSISAVVNLLARNNVSINYVKVNTYGGTIYFAGVCVYAIYA